MKNSMGSLARLITDHEDSVQVVASLYREDWTPEDIEHGERSEAAETVADNETFTWSELIRKAQDCGINQRSRSGKVSDDEWFSSSDPECHRQFIEEGIHSYYSLHIHLVNGLKPDNLILEAFCECMNIGFVPSQVLEDERARMAADIERKSIVAAIKESGWEAELARFNDDINNVNQEISALEKSIIFVRAQTLLTHCPEDTNTMYEVLNKTYFSRDGFTGVVDKNDKHGYFEHVAHGDRFGGELSFDYSGDNLELYDFDGVSLLPIPVGEALVDMGIVVGDEFLPDVPDEPTGP